MAAIGVRAAHRGDDAMVWRWRNDPATRAASFDDAEVRWHEHQRWFADALGRLDRHLLIVLDAGTPVGVVRYDREDDGWWQVSINLAPDARGRGIAAAALEEGLRWLVERERVTGVRALARPDNEASLRLFVRAGFDETSRDAHSVELRLALGASPL